jgi:hypothetical protein
MVSRGALGPGFPCNRPSSLVYWIHKEGRMERFKEVMGFIVIGLLPLTMCGAVYLAEVLGR